MQLPWYETQNIDDVNHVRSVAFPSSKEAIFSCTHPLNASSDALTERSNLVLRFTLKKSSVELPRVGARVIYELFLLGHDDEHSGDLSILQVRKIYQFFRLSFTCAFCEIHWLPIHSCRQRNGARSSESSDSLSFHLFAMETSKGPWSQRWKFTACNSSLGSEKASARARYAAFGEL